jgi:hypothetical protein
MAQNGPRRVRSGRPSSLQRAPGNDRAGVIADAGECPCGNVFKVYIAQLMPANTLIALVATFGPDDPESLAAALADLEREVEPILGTVILPWEIAAN